ncbi:hypothetical protein CU019_1117 [Enterococcus faecium]|nr:hypothetical protein [Enterococcus faecium]MBK4782635.1 hypothetical protein [Enterococcus faecium]MBK4790082.1 hypothetical protein [Enterococcus faecium]MBK4798318.1 hypothetical protein [Enterococcus faecium]MBK4810374.1 hypothetical protein [Enterococcus faecium]
MSSPVIPVIPITMRAATPNIIFFILHSPVSFFKEYQEMNE